MSREAAYHEAGHAVLAWKSAFYTIGGPIELSAYKSGATSVALSKKKLLSAGKNIDQSFQSDPDVAEDFAVILCAGLVAEYLAAERGVLITPCVDSAIPDHDFAKSALGDAGLSQDLAPYKDSAKKGLLKHWAIVELLSNELLKQGGCDAVDAVDIIRGADAMNNIAS